MKRSCLHLAQSGADASGRRSVAGDLRLSYAQFEELETFARFGTRLDADTRQTLAYGRVARQILKQPQFEPMPVPHQIAVLLSAAEGVFDELPLDRVSETERALRDAPGGGAAGMVSTGLWIVDCGLANEWGPEV